MCILLGVAEAAGISRLWSVLPMARSPCVLFVADGCGLVAASNVNRSPRQTAATREAPAAVRRRAGGLVGHLPSL